MDALLSILRSAARLLNLLLPFTNRSTPLLQDLIHTIALCSALYFAPNITEYLHSQQNHDSVPPDSGTDQPNPDTLDGDPPNIPHDIGIVVDASDASETEDERLPQAPTPPDQPNPPPPNQHPNQNPNANPLPLPLPAQNENIPAGPEHPRATPQNRPIGTKKAKSLARRDQRRAYHEFLQNEREQRLREAAATATEQATLLASEKARRAEVERAIAERERVEREKKKEAERREQEEEGRRRERVVNAVREGLMGKGAVDLGRLAWEEGKDVGWVERVVRAAGVLGARQDGGYTMVTGEGWAVSVDAQLMREVYEQAVVLGDKGDGKVGMDAMAQILEKTVQQRAKA